MMNASDFGAACHAFAESCGVLWFERGGESDEGWVCEDRGGATLLRATVVRPAVATDDGGNAAASSDAGDADADMEEEAGATLIALEAADAAALPPRAPPLAPLHRLRYDVAYDATFGAPVLLFSGADAASGAPLSLRSIVGEARSGFAFRAAPDAAPWPAVTQEEHPLLGSLCFKVHPCRTEEVMALLLGSSGGSISEVAPPPPAPAPPLAHYIAAWLCLVGPAARLTTPSAARFKAMFAKHAENELLIETYK